MLIVFFAGYLVMKRDVLSLARSRVLGIDFPRGRDLGPILGVWLVSVGVLVFERDLGTSVLFFGLFVAMLYVATERRRLARHRRRAWRSSASPSPTTLFGHVRVRFDVWLHPFADASGAGYQSVQALYGMADGGILGSGIAQGHPDLVPYANSDFISAALGELLGVTGFMAMLVLYAIVVARGLSISLAARDPFGRLLAFGLAFVLGLQVFVVVGGVTNLIPLTGLTTPFLSAGGSSLVANWALDRPAAAGQRQRPPARSSSRSRSTRPRRRCSGDDRHRAPDGAHRRGAVPVPARAGQPHPGRQGRRPQQPRRATPARSSTPTASSAARSSSAAPRSRGRSTPATRGCATSAATADGPLYAPATGFYSHRLRRHRHRAPGERAAQRRRPAPHRQPAAGPDQRRLAPGRRPSGSRSTPPPSRPRGTGIKQYNGAVVAIEPSTGRILAMATSPSFDPNPLSSNDPAAEPQRPGSG